MITNDSCGFSEYDVLYEDPATKLTPIETTKDLVLYMVTTKDVTFLLSRTNEFILCGYTIIRTEHPKLFVMETSPGRTFKEKIKISIENLDIFAYVNSKFIYIKRHRKRK